MICGQSDSLKIVWKDQPEHHMAHTYTVVAQNHHVLSPQQSEQPPPLNFAATYVAHRGSSRPVTPGIPPGVPVTPPGVCFPNLVQHGDSPSMQEEAAHRHKQHRRSNRHHPSSCERISQCGLCHWAGRSSASDPSDLEKKREWFIEQQMRRREEQDRRRLQLMTDAAKKREMNRLKQEQTEQKKAEEKTRREAPAAPAEETARLAKRPKSQPPVSHDDRASHSSSHSSQEELYLHGRCPVLNLKSVPATTGGQPDFTPPFGGFMQRWPGTPDKTSWPGTDNNGSETGSNAPSQYSDNATICKKEDLPPGNLVPHPYLRNKFYDCKPYVTYKREQNVYMHEDHVFNPYTDDSDFPDNVSCAVQIRKFWTTI
ncbi:hypothetical protein LSAT2_030767 [Lamellibrachia satsuma]|nr:hypothetical protein LSAT2_030767 [Lamellibrachia satsuma]